MEKLSSSLWKCPRGGGWGEQVMLAQVCHFLNDVLMGFPYVYSSAGKRKLKRARDCGGRKQLDGRRGVRVK